MSRPSERFGALQSQGSRDYQEDEFGILDDRDLSRVDSEHTLLVVADGMGGHQAGATASKIVTETFIDAYHNCSGTIPSRLLEGLQQANSHLEESTKENSELQGMGTTIVAATVTNDGLHWISVGDSPLWIYQSGELKRVNADHSMAPVFADMVASGRMTKTEAATNPQRNALRSALMGDELGLVDASLEPLPLYSGDLLILASDGVMTLSQSQITSVLELSSKENNEVLVGKLMNAVLAQEKSNQDNTTILAYSIEVKTNDQDTVIPARSSQGNLEIQ
ncbi:MAG: hypothetical protein COA96_04520 [SAR86 cluster bacterium]|uniref:PPM-type phosphatase domain-containing protein n=1 Tax=SAR86 cluster bacterium TaxID=2030880 RepID=A0A2A5B716_9GAMM|nr:MAG: hypothetical protein COA96_04520 [SAR86 cluster bacterium]